MSMQVCGDVTKPLVSVRAMLQVGNKVMFDQWASGVKTTVEIIESLVESMAMNANFILTQLGMLQYS